MSVYSINKKLEKTTNLVLRKGAGKLTSGKTVAVVVVVIAAVVVAATVALYFSPPGRTNTTASSSSHSTSTTSSHTSVSSIVNVAIVNGSGLQKGAPYYVPNDITVVIGINNTVIWTNDDTEFGGVIHTVTANTKAFDSGNMNAGAAWTYTFNTPGTYTYYCVYHAWMKGVVVVKQG